MKNLSIENITRACKGTFHGDESILSQEVSGVVIDSRKVQPGYLFVAIDGERVNAHKFIPDTVKAGAMCVVSHEDLGETDFPYILVESTGQALLDIAKLYRDSFDMKVVGNFNNEWGLPITIFDMPEDTEVAVLEMGVNHFGEMRRLSSVSSPDICVITNIGIAHLEFFKTREGILQEKSQMIQDMKNGGSIILNGDDDLLCKMSPVKGVAPVFFGTGSNCAFRADNIEPQGLRGTSCTITLKDGTSFDCLVPVPGIHMVSNAVAGAAVGYTLGLTASEIKAGIESLPSIPGRNHIIETDHMIILDDCYNANPISMKASIDVLNMAIGRRVAVLGNMGELGDTAEVLHAEVGTYAAQQNVDLVCGIGDLTHALVEEASRGTHTQALWFADNESFIQAIPDIIKDGDNVLVKASHGMNFPQIVHALEEL